MTVDAGAGGLAIDHRWAPQLKTPGSGWLGKNPAACCVACAGVVDLRRPVKQYERCVRSAYNAVMDWYGGGVSWNKPEEEKDRTRLRDGFVPSSLGAA